MKFVSWNVNGLRAICGKGFAEIFSQFNADFFCLQETKLQEGQIDLAFPGYQSFWNYAHRKGYSGTVIFTRHQPLSSSVGIGIDTHDTEGRVVTVEMDDFYLVNVYTPNSGAELARLPYRKEWDAAFADYARNLDAKKPVVICGDFNVAHNEIDLYKPQSNHDSAGFTYTERQGFGSLLDAGFVDTFRALHPDTKDAYTWWSYKYRAREHNRGWRIDYFLVSTRLAPRIADATILPTIPGSDHCPVTLTLT